MARKPCTSTRIAGHSILTKVQTSLALPSTTSSFSYSRELNEKLSLSVSLSAVLSATFLIKRPPRTVSSTAPCPLARNIKIPGRRSRAGFDRSNEFPSKSSRPTCDAEELVVAVTAIARSKTSPDTSPWYTAPCSSSSIETRKHRCPRSLNGGVVPLTCEEIRWRTVRKGNGTEC